MKLGFVSDSLGGMSFDEMLDHAARMGVSGIEVNTCGWSTAPHFDLEGMLGNASAQRAFLKAFIDRGLEVIGLNANGNPLHPTDPAQGEGLKDTIRVAGEMGIKTVCTMSGLPAGNATDTMPNWVVASWPPETQAILRYQWEEKLIPFWVEIVALAKENGVERIALELLGNQCVYNVPSLLKLRGSVGPVIGAKGSSRKNRVDLRSRQEGLIPLAMELRAPDVEGLHLNILDRHVLGIVVLVHVAIDFEAGAGRGGADKADDGGEGSQRLAAPVLADEREQAVFDSVPFAGSGRQMANRGLEPRFAGEFLQFNPPAPYPSPVGATTVDRDQQA